jgi:hypothetical protein
MQTVAQTAALLRLSGRLENWRAWLKSREPNGHCGSLESHYRSPQIWYPPGPRPPDPDGADAWDITIAAATLPLLLHLTLRLRHVVYGLEDAQIAAIIRKELRTRARTADVKAWDYLAQISLLTALDRPLSVSRSMAVLRIRRALSESS